MSALVKLSSREVAVETDLIPDDELMKELAFVFWSWIAGLAGAVVGVGGVLAWLMYKK